VSEVCRLSGYGTQRAHTEAWLTAAFHECGHAAAYRYFGWPFADIELHETHDGVVNGFVRGARHPSNRKIDFACCCMGGPVAEAMHGCVDWQELPEDVLREDVRMAHDALGDMADLLLAAVAVRTRSMLRKEWRSVERTAHALAGRRRLTYAEFLEVAALAEPADLGPG
jgi:hypothetical protein